MLLPYPGEAKNSLSNLIQFHDVEHLEQDAIDVSVPTLVEMTIAPMRNRSVLHLVIDLIHDGTLLIQIEDQVGIILYPGTDARLALHFAKGRGSVCDDRINRILSKYLRQKFLIEHWHLVLPIIVQSQWVLIIKNVSEPQLIHHVSVPCRYSILPVDRDGSSDTQGSMSVRLHHRIIRDGHESLVRNCLSVKVGRIVMVATHKHYPIVRLPHSLVVAIEDTLVIPFLFETEPAITSNDYHSILQLILDAHLVHQHVEVAMDISANYQTFAVREIVCQNILFIHSAKIGKFCSISK